jgi:hypothetical protein
MFVYHRRSSAVAGLLWGEGQQACLLFAAHASGKQRLLEGRERIEDQREVADGDDLFRKFVGSMCLHDVAEGIACRRPDPADDGLQCSMPSAPAMRHQQYPFGASNMSSAPAITDGTLVATHSGQPLLVHIARLLEQRLPDEEVGQAGPQPPHLQHMERCAEPPRNIAAAC